MNARQVMAWRSQAACRVADDQQRERFFPIGRPGNEAKSFCGRCPVREECLEFALTSPWRPGAIVAGLTPGELEPMWRTRHPDNTGQREIQQLLGLR